MFDENMTAQVLKETVERQVAERYPETEAHIPREERKGHIPSTIKQMIEDQYSDRTGNDKIPLGLNKMVTVNFEKHAVPESAARAIEDAMEDITPSSLHTEKWPSYEGGLPMKERVEEKVSLRSSLGSESLRPLSLLQLVHSTVRSCVRVRVWVCGCARLCVQWITRLLQ